MRTSNVLAEARPERIGHAYQRETWTRLTAIKQRSYPTNLFHANHNILRRPGGRRSRGHQTARERQAAVPTRVTGR